MPSANKVPAAKSEGEELMALHIRIEKLPSPEREFAFARPERKWRFDFAWPAPRRIAVEVEGGTRGNGRHVRHAGFVNDAEKYNTATILGWRVLRFTTDQVRDGTAIATLKRAFT